MNLSNKRLGKFTASSMHLLLVGGKGATRDKYIRAKAEEIVRGHAKSNFSNRHTEHGHMNEGEAGAKFQELTGLIVDYLNQEFFEINENCGSTPDFAVVDFSGKYLASVDVKCPTETFFEQKLMFIQAQMQMMSLKVDTHYLVRYMTSSEVDDDGNKIEYDIPLESRMFWTKITADKPFQDMLLAEIVKASKERDLYVEIFRKPILQNP